MKKYNLKCNYCSCDNYVSLFFLRLRLIIKGNIYVRCSNCGNISNYVLVSHIVHNTVDLREKELNKEYKDNKMRLWKRG